MRRLIPLLIFLAPLAVVAPARGYPTGTIRGTAVDGNTGRPRGGVTMVLTGSTESGDEAIHRRSVTGNDGTYIFHDLPTGADRFYLIDGHFDGGLFPGRAVSLPSDTTEPPVIDSTLKVWETTTDPESIVMRRDDLFALVKEDDVAIIESVTVVNTTDEAYIGRGQAIDPTRKEAPTLGFALPQGAEKIRIADSDIDVPELVPVQGIGFGVTFAIPPGETRLAYTYTVPGSAGNFDISRRALYPILEMSVMAAPPIVVDSALLESDGEVTVSETRYNRWTSRDTIEAADPIRLSLTAEAGVAPGLIAGIVATVALALGLSFLAFRRARKAPERRAEAAAIELAGRNDLVEAIASLDLEHDAGKIDRAAWEERRAELKERLQSLTVSERT